MSNSRFATTREIKETLVPIGQKQSGGLVLYVDKDGALVERSEGHSIIIGSSGSGKTRRMTIPTIMSLIASEESFLIGDSKGDVRDATYCYAKEKGYRTVMLDFRDIEHSTSLNFLMYPYLLYKKGETDKASDIVRIISHSIIKINGKDPFWDNSARSLFEACTFLLFEYGSPEEVNFLSVIRMIATGVERFGPKKIFDIICEDCPGSIADLLLQNVRTAPNDTLNSILSSTFQPLNIFVESPALIDLLTNNEFAIDSLDGDTPTAIYVVIPDEHSNFSDLCAILVSEITTYYIQLAHEKYNGRLTRRMNIILEEAGNLPAIPNLGQLMSAGRSRNVRLMLVFQSLPSQLEAIYGKSNAETIIANAGTFVVFRTNQYETQNEFSRQMGCRFVDYGNKVIEERLIKPEEIGAMETGRVLIIMSGRVKFSTVLPDYTETFAADLKRWYPPHEEKHLRHKCEIFDLKQKAMEIRDKKDTPAPEIAEYIRDNREEERLFRKNNQIKLDDLYYRVDIGMKLSLCTIDKFTLDSIFENINEHRTKKLKPSTNGIFSVFFTDLQEALKFRKMIRDLLPVPTVSCIVCVSERNFYDDVF